MYHKYKKRALSAEGARKNASFWPEMGWARFHHFARPPHETLTVCYPHASLLLLLHCKYREGNYYEAKTFTAHAAQAQV